MNALIPRRSTPVIAAALLFGLAANALAQAPRDWKQPLSENKKIAHALNRLGFGPRPGDAARVREMGVGRWIELQLSPEKIDDNRVDQKLSGLKTLQMSAQDLMLVQLSDQGKVARKIKETQRPNKSKKAVDAQPVKLNARQQETLAMIEDLDIAQGTSIQAIGELQLDKTTRAVESNRQLFEVLVDFWSNHFNLDVKKNAVRTLKIVDEREVIRPNVFGKFRDLLGASAKSPAMLIYLDNASSTREMTAPVRGQNRNPNRLRRNLNKNRAATVATPDAVPATPKKRGGINENYARELMELHTLGVDGGYTQTDVQEVARCFTGWSVDRTSGAFIFRKFAHDDGAKTVLGQIIPAGGGIADGERVLDILVSRPATAKFISRKLCVRLVADEPPTSIVDKAAKTFQNTDGDLRAVVKTIVTSSKFFSTGAYRAKIKSPFEYAVSATRALGGTILIPDASTPRERLLLVSDGAVSVRPNGGNAKNTRQKTLNRSIAEMGQPLYSYQAPTGYSEDSREWVSSGALVSRLNFALALTEDEISNVIATPTVLLKGVDERDRETTINRLTEQLLANDVSNGTRSTLQRETTGEKDTPVDRKKLTALILGSPEFQRH